MSTLQQAIALVQMGVDSSTLDHQGAAAASHRNQPQPSVDESGNHPFHHQHPSAMTQHQQHQQRSQQQMVPQHQGSMGGHQQLPQHYASGCGGGGVSSGSPSTNFANNLRALASLESQQNFQQTPLNVAQQFVGFGGNGGGHSGGGYGNGSRHSDYHTQQQSGAANSQYHHQQRSQQSGGFNNTGGLVQPYQSQNHHRSNGYEQQQTAMSEFRAGGGNQV